ncbi:MAG: hypothetical protein IJ089_00450 [Clostridia bacterium]|nr:hypothetical protein [Clostridia bacterium]
MEINAEYTILANDVKLLKNVLKLILSFLNIDSYDFVDRGTTTLNGNKWYFAKAESGPTIAPDERLYSDGPDFSPEEDTWEDMLNKCGEILGKDGIVVVEFRSPDHPDDYDVFEFSSPYGCEMSYWGLNLEDSADFWGQNQKDVKAYFKDAIDEFNKRHYDDDSDEDSDTNMVESVLKELGLI